MPAAKTIDDIENIVIERGGTLLTTHYKNCKSLLKIMCNCGHIWKTSYDILRKGSWCKICSGKKLTLKDAKDIAKSLNGKCLSKTYKNTYTKMLWRCEFGHKWETDFRNIKYKKSWCPKCSCGLHERICRGYFELLFGKQFPTKRPTWLRNNKCNLLELDGYCAELGLAFEFNGKQHYEEISIYTNVPLEERIETDLLKRNLCKSNGVTLITIPYSVLCKDNLKILQSFIMKELANNGFCVKAYDIHNMKIYSSKIDEMHILAKNKGGKFLSTTYNGSSVKHYWQCKCGHQWKATPAMVKSGTWCRECYIISRRKCKVTYDDLQTIILRKDGKCLSGHMEYKNLSSMLRLQCVQGHIWTTRAAIIRNGSWCPSCKYKKQGKRFKY